MLVDVCMLCLKECVTELVEEDEGVFEELSTCCGEEAVEIEESKVEFSSMAQERRFLNHVKGMKNA